MEEENHKNNWSSKKEEVLNNWCFESELYIWLHNYNAEYYNGKQEKHNETRTEA